MTVILNVENYPYDELSVPFQLNNEIIYRWHRLLKKISCCSKARETMVKLQTRKISESYQDRTFVAVQI